MKRIIIVLLVLFFAVSITACREIAESYRDSRNAETKDREYSEDAEETKGDEEPEDAAETEAESNAPDETTEPGAEAVSLLYADPEIDIFIMVQSGDWKYTKELYEGEVYFYPGDENPSSSYTGFAISSQAKGDFSIEDMWNYVQSSLKAGIRGFDWSKEDDISVGDYSACRYHFSGTDMTGDYIMWETDELLYICSFTSEPGSYDDNYAMLAASLATFQVLSEM